MGKMYCKTLEIGGLYPAVKGMRNPKNSWDKIDSYNTINGFVLGDNDKKLAQTLIVAGIEHCKFLRMIQVWVDINMPRYFWSEYDTYHYNTKNSCSTMHKLFNKNKELTLDDFYYETEYEKRCIGAVIEELYQLEKQYFEETQYQEVKDKILATAKRILPESYLQLRTVNTNYAELRNIYFQRKHHRLVSEWQDTFCCWIKTLPYANELILFK